MVTLNLILVNLNVVAGNGEDTYNSVNTNMASAYQRRFVDSALSYDGDIFHPERYLIRADEQITLITLKGKKKYLFELQNNFSFMKNLNVFSLLNVFMVK